jgi:hypothetical protein
MPHLNGVVATDGAWLAGLWVGGANHLAASQDNVLALPDLAADENMQHGIIKDVCLC